MTEGQLLHRPRAQRQLESLAARLAGIAREAVAAIRQRDVLLDVLPVDLEGRDVQRHAPIGEHALDAHVVIPERVGLEDPDVVVRQADCREIGIAAARARGQRDVVAADPESLRRARVQQHIRSRLVLEQVLRSDAVFRGLGLDHRLRAAVEEAIGVLRKRRLVLEVAQAERRLEFRQHLVGGFAEEGELRRLALVDERQREIAGRPHADVGQADPRSTRSRAAPCHPSRTRRVTIWKGPVKSDAKRASCANRVSPRISVMGPGIRSG